MANAMRAHGSAATHLQHMRHSPQIENTSINPTQKKDAVQQSSTIPAAESSNEVTTQEHRKRIASEQMVHQMQPTWKVKWQLASACLMNFSNGMNDGAPGALIPYIESDYKIGYATVSLIFIANAIGFIAAAPLTQAIEMKLGRAKTYGLSMCLMTVGYVVIVAHPPFPMVVVAFFLLGFGMALSLALNNVYCANLANQTTAMGCFTGAYGIGGTISPLFATAMVSSAVSWNLFYTITMSASAFNAIFAGWAFRGYQDGNTLESQGNVRSHATGVTSNDGTSGRLRLLKLSIQNRTTLLGSLFVFAYQGAEVSISGWVISFLISYRDGDPGKVGYVSAGFWAGITLGRFLLVYPANRLGEKVSVGLMVVGSVAVQLTVWLVPNIIGNAVSIAVLGVLLGAVFPCATAVFARLLPRQIQISSLSFVSALGSSGGAVFPFLTGLLAQRFGTTVLHPVCLSLYAVMVVSWFFLPKLARRDE